MTQDSAYFEPHEYLRDTLTLTYKECKSCTNRTEFTCIKCGLCWSCHWKVEQIHKSELFARSQVQPSEEREKSEQHQHILDKQGQYTRINVIDVFGRETEPICDYLRCHHKFSIHGFKTHMPM